jgi:hypothetical protein
MARRIRTSALVCKGATRTCETHERRRVAATGTQVNSQRERMREKNRFLALRDLVEKLELQKGGGVKTAAEKAAEKKKKQKARRKRKSSKKQAAGDTDGLVAPPFTLGSGAFSHLLRRQRELGNRHRQKRSLLSNSRLDASAGRPLVSLHPDVWLSWQVKQQQARSQGNPRARKTLRGRSKSRVLPAPARRHASGIVNTGLSGPRDSSVW